MKKINFEDFDNLLEPIRIYLKELEIANEAIEKLCPSSYPTIDVGCKLLTSYVNLAEQILEDTEHWVDWFVFEDNFGEKLLECEFNDVKYTIRNVTTFYTFLTNTLQ